MDAFADRLDKMKQRNSKRPKTKEEWEKWRDKLYTYLIANPDNPNFDKLNEKYEKACKKVKELEK